MKRHITKKVTIIFNNEALPKNNDFVTSDLLNEPHLVPFETAYSTTSRQVKAYVNRCEQAGKRVAQVLIVAPTFSDDFVESAEMDTEGNISLLEADGLKSILNAYKARRNPKFSEKLFTKGWAAKSRANCKEYSVMSVEVIKKKILNPENNSIVTEFI